MVAAGNTFGGYLIFIRQSLHRQILAPQAPKKISSTRSIFVFSITHTSVDIKISFALRVWHVFHVAFAALGQLIAHMVRNKGKK